MKISWLRFTPRLAWNAIVSPSGETDESLVVVPANKRLPEERERCALAT
jgi:hypothetical protein